MRTWTLALTVIGFGAMELAVVACGSDNDTSTLTGEDAAKSEATSDDAPTSDSSNSDASSLDASDASDTATATDGSLLGDGGIPSGHQLAVGNSHSCRIKAGAIKCWGKNDKGQLGNGTMSPAASFVDVIGITNAVEIAGGGDRTCARLSTGHVKCWGDGDGGRLGNNATASSGTPVDVSNLVDAIAITAGDYNTCVLRSNGHTACWGSNGIGDGSSTRSVPTEPTPAFTDAVGIGAGWGHTCVLRSNGSAKCWGTYNVWGQVGDGTKQDRTTPVDVLGITNGSTVALGTYHSCARLSNATVACWGNNQGGQLGLGTKDEGDHSATAVPGLTDVASIYGNGFGTCAITTNGTPYCWGSSPGTGFGASTSPQEVTALGKTTEIAGGSGHTCALKANGEIACWGYSSSNELGYDAGGAQVLMPVVVSGI